MRNAKFADLQEGDHFRFVDGPRENREIHFSLLFVVEKREPGEGFRIIIVDTPERRYESKYPYVLNCHPWRDVIIDD